MINWLLQQVGILGPDQNVRWLAQHGNRYVGDCHLQRLEVHRPALSVLFRGAAKTFRTPTMRPLNRRRQQPSNVLEGDSSLDYSHDLLYPDGFPYRHHAGL